MAALIIGRESEGNVHLIGPIDWIKVGVEVEFDVALTPRGIMAANVARLDAGSHRAASHTPTSRQR